MGIYLQRSWVVDLITATLLMPLLIFGTPIFNFLGEEPGIAEATGYISWWFIPMVYNFVFTLTMRMFLQAQQKNTVVAIRSIVQIVVHVPLSWLFVYYLNWGVDGAMGALVASNWLVAFAEFGYIMGGWCPQTWTGFSSAAFKDLLPVVKLSISSGVMICIYPVLSGVAIGAGLQGTVAVINLCCFYLMGILIGALLGYFANLGVKGIWIGMNIGILCQTLATSYMAWKTDWDHQVKVAAEQL